VPWFESTAIISEPDIVAAVAKKECQAVVIVGAVGSCTLKQSMHQEYRIASLSIRVLIRYLACDVGVGEDIQGFVVALLWGAVRYIPEPDLLE
jgi:hypothetical protein